MRAVTSRRIAEKARGGEREAAAALCALTAEHRELVARLVQERLSSSSKTDHLREQVF